MNSSDDTSSAYPSMATGEDVSLREVSHVFHCMQCDLQFQVDMAITSRNGPHEIDTGVVRVRLDPRNGRGNPPLWRA